MLEVGDLLGDGGKEETRMISLCLSGENMALFSLKWGLEAPVTFLGMMKVKGVNTG